MAVEPAAPRDARDPRDPPGIDLTDAVGTPSGSVIDPDAPDAGDVVQRDDPASAAGDPASAAATMPPG